MFALIDQLEIGFNKSNRERGRQHGPVEGLRGLESRSAPLGYGAVELRTHLADRRYDGEALYPVGPARREEHAHLATIGGATRFWNLLRDSKCVLRLSVYGETAQIRS